MSAICYNVPEWAKGAIFYQLLVDRFCKSKTHEKDLVSGRNYREWKDSVNWHRNIHGSFHNNDFFCGDLNGIKEKIPFFKSLGVSVLYLSPINLSLYRYDRYAATNHMLIDPDVGSFSTLDNLHQTALKNNIHIILDIAFNHCCTNNPIYKDAFNNPDSKYWNWFKRDSHGNICFWYGFDDMPEFNQFSKDYQKYVYGDGGVIEKYSKYVDGFRLDLAENLEPFFIEGIKNKANENSPHLIVGEYWSKVPRSLLNKCIDSPTCYPMTNAILKFLCYGEYNYLEEQMKELVNYYPQSTIDSMLISLDTHDIIRALTILGKTYLMRTGLIDIWKIDDYPSPWHRDDKFYTDEFRQFEFDNDVLTPEEYEHATALLKVGAVLQYFYIGSPCLYYGTESGMYGFKDPFNRKPYPWGNEDTQLLKFFMALGTFRKSFNSVRANPVIQFKDSGVFSFTRENEYNSLFVVVNRSNEPRKFIIPKKFIDGYSFSVNLGGNNTLLPYGALVILKK